MIRTCSLLLVLLLAACGDSTPAPVTPTGSPVQGGSELKPGSPGCTHVVAGKCFSDAESACKEAGCAMDKCRQAETHPVQVSCPK